MQKSKLKALLLILLIWIIIESLERNSINCEIESYVSNNANIKIFCYFNRFCFSKEAFHFINSDTGGI